MTISTLQAQLEANIAGEIANMPETDGIKVVFKPRTEDGWQTLTANGKPIMLMAGVEEGTSRTKPGGNGKFTYLMDFMCKSKTRMWIKKKDNSEIALFLYNRAIHVAKLDMQREKDAVIRAEADKQVEQLRTEFGWITDTHAMKLSSGVETDAEGNSFPIIRIKMDDYFTLEQARQILEMVKGQ